MGHDILTLYDTGKAGQAVSDDEVLETARQDSRVLLTFNRKHFIRLHRQHPDHAGIIVCTFDPDFAALALRIHSALVAQPAFDNQLIRINRPQQ